MGHVFCWLNEFAKVEQAVDESDVHATIKGHHFFFRKKNWSHMLGHSFVGGFNNSLTLYEVDFDPNNSPRALTYRSSESWETGGDTKLD